MSILRGQKIAPRGRQAHADCAVSCWTFSECTFTCTSGQCLYLGSLVCNQQNDCGDNSDEENCLLVTEHPPPGIFSCKSLLLAVPLSRAVVFGAVRSRVLGRCGGWFAFSQRELFWAWKDDVSEGQNFILLSQAAAAALWLERGFLLLS